MAKEEADWFEVVITSSAEAHFYELVEYMSSGRAEQVARELHEMALVLIAFITGETRNRN